VTELGAGPNPRSAEKVVTVAVHKLTELQYGEDRKGPFKMYIYEPHSEYHRGGVWFRKKPLYPDEEITTAQAHNRAFAAVAKGLEVRICDGGDMLVFHAKDGKILYPENPKEFWEACG